MPKGLTKLPRLNGAGGDAVVRHWAGGEIKPI
jgi:hypothetical protein